MPTNRKPAVPKRTRDQIVVATALAYEALAYVQRASFAIDQAGRDHLDLAEAATLLRQAAGRLEDLRDG